MWDEKWLSAVSEQRSAKKDRKAALR